MKVVFSLYKKHCKIINYLMVGFLTTVISLSIYYICVFFFVDPNIALQLQIANVISWICAVIFAFFANRIFVFKSKNKNLIKEFVSFVVSRVLTLFIDMISMFILVTVLFLNDKIAKVFVQFIILILNYLFSKIFVFKNNK